MAARDAGADLVWIQYDGDKKSYPVDPDNLTKEAKQ